MKLIGSLLKTVFKIIMFGLIAMLMIPLIYFAWRASQPMELPQFDGRTYFEWLEIRHAAYDDLAGEYRISHPKQDVKDGICFLSEAGIQLVAAFSNAGFYALAGLYPSLQRFVDPRDRRDGCHRPPSHGYSFCRPGGECMKNSFGVWQSMLHMDQSPIAEFFHNKIKIRGRIARNYVNIASIHTIF